MPSFCNSSRASRARETSEPVAMRINCGTTYEQMRNGTERSEMLDRLMRGAVFAKSDRVMRKNIDDLHFRQAGETNRGPHVIRKAHERAAIRNQPAVKRHPS